MRRCEALFEEAAVRNEHRMLPFPTDFDDSDLAGMGADPMGTLAGAERLADRILPAMTARMWRPRYLTFAAIAAQVSQRVAAESDREAILADARMAFERLFVSALVRKDGEVGWEAALDGLQGRRLAKRAYLEGKPLTPWNFLSGAAVNGPFGVIARLARATGIVDDEELPGTSGTWDELAAAWGRDRRLPGFVHPDRDRISVGSKLLRRWAETIRETTRTKTRSGNWPADKAGIWTELRDQLRPDVIGIEERGVLRKILRADPVRARVMSILYQERARYKELDDQFDKNRGAIEYRALTKIIEPALGSDALGAEISAAITAALAFEDASGVLHAAFESLLWGLARSDGSAKPDVVIRKAGDRFWEKLLDRARTSAKNLELAVKCLQEHPELDKSELREPLQQLHDVLGVAQGSTARFVDSIKTRHLSVQEGKDRPPWIDFGDKWILGRGIAADQEQPLRYEKVLIHPFRIQNAVAFLAALKGLGSANG